MRRKNFNNDDETLKYLESAKQELKIRLEVIDDLIAKRGGISKSNGDLKTISSSMVETYDFSNISAQKAILQILAENKKGLLVKEIAQQLLQNGFKSESKDFEKIVYNTMYALKRQNKVKKKGALWLSNENHFNEKNA